MEEMCILRFHDAWAVPKQLFLGWPGRLEPLRDKRYSHAQALTEPLLAALSSHWISQ